MVIHLGDKSVAQARPEGGKNSLPWGKGIAQDRGAGARKATNGIHPGNVERRCAAEKCGLRTVQKFVENEAVPTSARPQLGSSGFVRRGIVGGGLIGKGSASQIPEVQL